MRHANQTRLHVQGALARKGKGLTSVRALSKQTNTDRTTFALPTHVGVKPQEEGHTQAVALNKGTDTDRKSFTLPYM